MAKRVPVVMIHGAFCGGWSFANWRDPYEARGFVVHTPTLRHHSSREEAARLLGGVSIREYCADIAALLGRFDSPPVVVGHSLGGLIAQMLAAQGRVRALILLAPLAPWGMVPSTPFEWMSMQALCWEGVFRNKSIPPRPQIAEIHALERLPEESRVAIVNRLVPESGLALFEAMHWFLDLHKTTFVEPRSVTCPILCIAGGRDRIVSATTVRRVARRYGGRARYELLRDHGHWLHGEPGWERIAAGSLNWLDEVLDRDWKRVSGGP
jgi:pimeloyl-ACP methyl ester carboxylesterase